MHDDERQRQAFYVFAASGSNYASNNEPLIGRQLICVGVGCEWNCYSSDITRTFPISGHWAQEAKDMHDLVLDIQERCIELIRLGVNYQDLDDLRRKITIK